MRTDEVTTHEPTAAEAFALVDQKYTDLSARRDVVRDQLGQLRTEVDKARSVFRTSLARAEIDGTAAPSRADLDAKERELVVAEDRLGGLEEAVATLEPDWRAANDAALLEGVSALNGQMAECQEQIHANERQAERVLADLNDRNGQFSAKITQLSGERQRLEVERLTRTTGRNR